MSKGTLRKGLHTFEEFSSLVREDQKADLIDGVIYMTSPENTDANELFMWLGGLMSFFTARQKLGQVYGFRVAFKLDDMNGPEPDIAFVASKNLGRVERGRVIGPPDLAVEIVSPDSVQRDYERKREQYRRFGVKEYWIVDELEEYVTQLRLRTDGQYREVRRKRGELRSKALPGFWIRVEWLWQRPLPDPLDTLQEILSRQA